MYLSESTVLDQLWTLEEVLMQPMRLNNLNEVLGTIANLHAVRKIIDLVIVPVIFSRWRPTQPK